MAFEQSISFATDLDTNFGCYRLRIMTDSAGREGRRQRGGSATGICGWGVGRGGGLPTGILMMAYCALVRLVVAIVAFGGLPTGMVATGRSRKGGAYAGSGRDVGGVWWAWRGPVGARRGGLESRRSLVATLPSSPPAGP